MGARENILVSALQRFRPAPADGPAGRTVVLRARSDGRRRLGPAAGDALANLLASALLLAGLACAFSACCEPGGAAAFLVAALATATVLQLASAFGRGRLLAAAAAAMAVFATIALPTVRAGLFAFANQLIARFDETFDAYAALLPVAEGAAGPVFYLAAGAVAAALAWLLLERRSLVGLALAVLGCGAVCLWLRAGAAVPVLVLGGGGWLAAWHLAVGGRLASPGAAAASCLAGVALMAACMGAVGAYEPAPAVDALRGAVAAGVDEARFGDDALPEGDLAEVPGMGGDEERLAVTFEGVPQDQVGLRGFVGATFADGAWEPLDHAAYEGTWTGMFAWLSEQGFQPAKQRASLDDASVANGGQPTGTCTISLEAVGADRAYVYAPYSLRSAEGASIVGGRDGGTLAEGLLGERSYRIVLDDVADAEYQDAPAWLLEGGSSQQEGYAAAESVYRAFVHEHYLDVSEADRELVMRLLFAEETWDAEAADFHSTVSRVRAMLATLASYADEVEAPPAGEGFLAWFLEDAREGNSAYFSTAAVAALRAQGIPARYVEGYRIGEDELARLAASGENRLVLTDADAHAWAEAYRDGIGWVPVDASPGFCEQPYAADEVVEVNQGMAGGDVADADPAGSVGGERGAEDEGAAENADPARVAAVAGALLALAALLGVAVVVLEAVRARRRRLRAARLASPDQDVAVGALFDQMALVLRAAGTPFSAGFPLECAAQLPETYPDIVTAEYERVVDLMQRSRFGGKLLREHEMRTVRRFVGRLTSGMPAARGVRERLRRRYRDAL